MKKAFWIYLFAFPLPLFALVITLAAVSDGITLSSSPRVSTTVSCPDGTPIHVVIPVDCYETCGVNLPAESEIKYEDNK